MWQETEGFIIHYRYGTSPYCLLARDFRAPRGYITSDLSHIAVLITRSLLYADNPEPSRLTLTLTMWCTVHLINISRFYYIAIIAIFIIPSSLSSAFPCAFLTWPVMGDFKSLSLLLHLQDHYFCLHLSSSFWFCHRTLLYEFKSIHVSNKSRHLYCSFNFNTVLNLKY
jgi:hypothetical protein